jgi:hypothetical protein
MMIYPCFISFTYICNFVWLGIQFQCSPQLLSLEGRIYGFFHAREKKQKMFGEFFIFFVKNVLLLKFDGL